MHFYWLGKAVNQQAMPHVSLSVKYMSLNTVKYISFALYPGPSNKITKLYLCLVLTVDTATATKAGKHIFLLCLKTSLKSNVAVTILHFGEDESIRFCFKTLVASV